MSEKAETTLRERMEELMMRAARAGMEDSGRLLRMTPRELERELTAFSAKRQRAAEEMDQQAWLTGRYVMAALHAPRRYPARPDGVLRPPQEMDSEEMKRRFLSMAERRGNNGGR